MDKLGPLEMWWGKLGPLDAMENWRSLDDVMGKLEALDGAMDNLGPLDDAIGKFGNLNDTMRKLRALWCYYTRPRIVFKWVNTASLFQTIMGPKFRHYKCHLSFKNMAINGPNYPLFISYFKDCVLISNYFLYHCICWNWALRPMINFFFNYYRTLGISNGGPFWYLKMFFVSFLFLCLFTSFFFCLSESLFPFRGKWPPKMIWIALNWSNLIHLIGLVERNILVFKSSNFKALTLFFPSLFL